MKFDHHLHTSQHSPDSIMEPFGMIHQARRVGLDGVVITEHDYQWEAEELAELAAKAAPLRVFSGVEVSAREGHFLVYGLPSLHDVEPGIRLADLLKVVAGHRAAIIAAHPFRWDQPFDEIVADHGPVFHAIELVSNNVTAETRARAESLLRTHPMGASGSSDAHELATLGCYFSEIEGPVDTIAEFVAAVRRGKLRPGHRSGARLTSGPVGQRR